MLIEDARAIEATAKRILAQVKEGSVSCEEMRETMPVLKSASAIITAAQTSAAVSIAGREQHGDGGTEVLSSEAGLSRQEARSHIKTAETLREAPAVRDAVESGRVSPANARRLAEAIDKTGARTVSDDGELLSKAETMRPDQFAREARRWVVDRDGDGGESEHRRLRARRRLRMWDTDDGMVALHGEFDPATGRRIRNRLETEARRLYVADKKLAGTPAERRNFHQCMADALDALTASDASGDAPGSGKPFADICVVAHVDDDTGNLVAELPDGVRLPEAVLEELACNARLTGVVYDRGAADLAGRVLRPHQTHSRYSSPGTAAASTARPTRRCARSTTSDRCHKVDPPGSTTWCRCAGTATRGSTTTSGRSAPPTACTPCTRRGNSTSGRHTRRINRCCTCPASPPPGTRSHGVLKPRAQPNQPNQPNQPSQPSQPSQPRQPRQP